MARRRVNENDYEQDTSFEEEIFGENGEVPAEEQERLAFLTGILGYNVSIDREDNVEGSRHSLSIPTARRSLRDGQLLHDPG